MFFPPHWEIGIFWKKAFKYFSFSRGNLDIEGIWTLKTEPAPPLLRRKKF